MHNYIEKKFDDIAQNFINLKKLSPVIDKTAQICIEALKSGNKVMFCGNGGSAADSQHLAAELVGRYKLNRKAYNSIALTTDTSILTAVGNDFGYDTIFERQVEGLGKAGDVLIGLSTSGNSKNVVLAFKLAKEMGIKTIAFTGSNKSKMSELADLTINVPSNVTNNIQEMHIVTGHLICEIIEKELSPKTKALFLDRDGVINIDKGYTYKIDDFKFVDGIVKVCQKAQNDGYKIIVISNQSGVERGYYTIEDMNIFNDYMKAKFKENGVEITDVLCCPSLNSPDRKPNSGLFEKARDKYNIDMANSVSIGNSERDIVAAYNCGVSKNWLLTDDINAETAASDKVTSLNDIVLSAVKIEV